MPLSNSPVSFRPPRTRRSVSSVSRRDASRQSLSLRLLRQAKDLIEQGEKLFFSLTTLQQAGLIGIGVFLFVAGVLSLVYHEQIFHYMTSFAKGWREIRAGWLILWSMTFLVSFPPLIGYSSCVGLAGFVYGFPNGWFVVATASTLGATAAFLVSRYFLHDFVERLVAREPRFGALALTLKHDGVKLLVMIRLCPLPFSISNGLLSSVPTVHWTSFMLATTIATPKLLLHVWVGAQMAKLAESGDKMDAKTKAVSYIGIVIGTVAGIATGYWIYARTKRRAAELEELERVEAGGIVHEYEDDPDLAEAADIIREEDDDISLRDAWDNDFDYQDDESDRDHDAPSGSDVEDELIVHK